MPKIFPISVGLTERIYNPIFHVSQNDLDSIQLDITIYTNKDIVRNLTGTTVRIAIRKPSHLTVFQDCEIVDALTGKVRVTLTNQAYLEAGEHEAEIYLEEGNSVMVSNSFVFTSESGIMQEDTPESVNDWQVITEALMAYDLKPILVEVNPLDIITPEYIGQMAFDTVTKSAFIATDETAAGWRPISAGGGGEGGGGAVYWADIIGKPTVFTPVAHTHLWADLTDKPTTFPATAHTHGWTEITGKPATYPATAHTHLWADLTDKPTTFAPEAHNHPIAEITGLSTALGGKSDTGHTHAYNTLTGIPSTFAPTAHSHAITDVTGLQAALNAKLESVPAEYLTQTEGDDRYELKGGGGTLPSSGTTDPSGAPLYIGQIYINTITKEAWIAGSMAGDWQTISMDETGGGSGSVDWTAITGKPATFTPSAHTHLWADITDKPSTFAPAAHTHAYSTLTGIPTTFTPESHTHAWTQITATPTTLGGYGITDATPSTHIGTGGTSHAAATTGANGFMSSADKTKLNGVATGATVTADSTTNGNILINGAETTIYAHPTGDGNLHVPATGTGNNTKVLKAGATAGTISWANVDWAEVTGKPSTFTPATHTHVWANITDPPATYAPSAHTHAYNTLTGIPSTFTPTAHTHLWADITDKPTTFTPATHSHAISDVTNLQSSLNSKANSTQGLSLWQGTQADYDLLTPDSNTLYFITG